MTGFDDSNLSSNASSDDDLYTGKWFFFRDFNGAPVILQSTNYFGTYILSTCLLAYSKDFFQESHLHKN